MWRRFLLCIPITFLVPAQVSAEVTFEQRLKAQEAIERIRYANPIGARLPSGIGDVFQKGVSGTAIEITRFE